MRLSEVIAAQTLNLMYRTDYAVAKKLLEGFQALNIFPVVRLWVHQANAAPSPNPAVLVSDLDPQPTLQDVPLEYSLEVGGNKHNCAALRRAMISRGPQDVLREMVEQGGEGFSPLRVQKVADAVAETLKNLFI